MTPSTRILTLTTAALLAGCGTGGATATATPAPATATPATASPSPSPSLSSPTASPVAAEPALGRKAGDFAGPDAAGFGEVRPAKVFNGGDPTGLVTGISWESWGGAQAVGNGMSTYVPPGAPTSSGTVEPAQIVAFDLGPCDGTVMYRAVEWFFPSHGGHFDASTYEDVCNGTYVGTH